MPNKEKARLLSLLTVLLLLCATPASAEENSGGWAVSLGFVDFIESDQAMETGLEYRFRPFTLWKLDLIPAAGFAVTKTKSFWAYAGLRYDFPLSQRWTATPQLALGLYEKNDEGGKDLGGLVEFRSGLEVSCRLNRGGRLGLLFYHLSNSGIYEFNPGSESLVITWGQGRLGSDHISRKQNHW